VSVVGAPGVKALNIDPEAAASAYRDRVIGPFRGVLPPAALNSMEEQLSGACTVEIAAFDEFTKLLADPKASSEFDHVIFDTAPTGHTLRLLKLPGAWTEFIGTNSTGTSCLGPLAGLQAQQALYQASVEALTNPAVTTVILVARPEQTALREAERTRVELAGAGIHNIAFALNGVFHATDRNDPTATALENRMALALSHIPVALQTMPRFEVPVLPFAPIGARNLRRVFHPDASTQQSTPRTVNAPSTSSLCELIDAVELSGHGVVLTMGKGGVGKTTIAAAIAVELAHRGHRVHLSTTDPAAHNAKAVDGKVEGLTVSRIDPTEVTKRYSDEVMLKAAPDLDEKGRALLEEDLRSPCTEEIAVFRAFADVVAEGQNGFVILDTAPTGHTLLLLDAAESYHREIARSESDTPEAVRNLLPRLRDSKFTRVILISLPEATPVHEAARLQDDLRRAGIEPFAWVVNQSFLLSGSTDPVLKERSAREAVYIDEVRTQYSKRMAVVAWMAEEPAGATALRKLVGQPMAAVV
jgi:arsenite/tail-anchored protein-transporting ATPase